jgi:ligand-binding sensor domain-containing protein
MKPQITKLMLILLMFSGFLSRAQQFTSYTTDNGLPDNNVNGVAIDTNNHKWFGTSAGVAMFNDTTWKVYTTADGLIDNSVNCIAVDKNNNVWAGTDIGLSKFNGTTWTSYTTDSGLIYSMVSYIAADSDGSIWIGTNAGLSHLSGSVWTNYTTANGLPDNAIGYLAADEKGNIWIGTILSGLSKFNGTAFTNITLPDTLNNITAIAIGTGNTKLIGTASSGVAVLDSLDNWVGTYTTTEGLLDNPIQDIAKDSKGTMWFGIYNTYTQNGGITRNNESVWKSYTDADGLVNNVVRRIAVDKSDNIWIATGGGVSKLFDPHSGIEESAATALTVFPNPSSGEIHINGLTSAGNLQVMTIDGKVRQSTVLQKGSNTVSLQGLSTGIYILKYTTDLGCYSGKLVIR